MGLPPLGRSCLYTVRQDVLPHESVNTDVPMGISRQSYGNQNPPLRDFPCSDTALCWRDFPSQRLDFTAPWRDVLLLGNKRKSNSVVGIFPLGGSIHRWDFIHLKMRLKGTIVGQTTTRELHAKSSSKHLRVKAKFSKKSSNFKQNNHEIKQARSKQTLPFQKFTIFILKIFDYIHSNTYSVISNKGDTRSITYFCLLFLWKEIKIIQS